MFFENEGVVRLRPTVTWAQVLHLLDPQADATDYWPDNGLRYDLASHAVEYCLPDEPEVYDFICQIEGFAREGWINTVTNSEPCFYGPNANQAALRYWTEQLRKVEYYINKIKALEE